MEHQRQRISHEVDDFVAAAIYPGGTNVIDNARWGLWDYGGKQAPDSNCALIIDMTPIDGSNNGKPHTEYWNVGEAAVFGPVEDGKFLEGTRHPSQNCNAFQFMKYLQDNCGMERGRLSVEGVGVKALIGSTITFIRVPDTRDFSNLNSGLDPTTGLAKVATKQKDILVASKAQFSWEAPRKGTKAATAKTTTAPATAPATPTAASAPVNGDSNPLVSSIVAILTENDGALEIPLLMPKITEKLSVVAGLSAGKRIALIKTIKGDDGAIDPDKLTGLSTDWTVDEGVVALN